MIQSSCSLLAMTMSAKTKTQLLQLWTKLCNLELSLLVMIPLESSSVNMSILPTGNMVTSLLISNI